jgi:hypothetical protein
MPKIYDNVESTGDVTGNIEFQSDTFQLTDSTDPTKTWQVNQQGQPPSTDVTLYSFGSGAIPFESELAVIQNIDDGYVFVYTPNLLNDFQLVANHNPQPFGVDPAWALDGAPTGVTIDQNGLISWDGTGTVGVSNVVIRVANIFGVSERNVVMNITSGYAGNPVLAVDTLQFTANLQGDPIGTWSDASGFGHDFVQPTPANQPTIDVDVFAQGANGLKFNGTSAFMTTTSLSNQIFTNNNGSSGEVFVTFRYDSAPAPYNPIYWSNKTPSTFHILITHRTDSGGYFQFAGGSDVLSFPFSPNIGETYIIRFAWVANSYFEVQFEGLAPTQQAITSSPSVTGATSYQVIAGADGSTDATAYGGFTPLYSPLTYGSIVAYDSPLQAIDIQTNFDYLKSIWNPA